MGLLYETNTVIKIILHSQICLKMISVFTKPRTQTSVSGSWNYSMTKPTKWPVRPAKTQISLGIRPVWSEYSLCAHWVAKNPNILQADSEDSDQTGRMPRLIWVFAGRTGHFVGFVVLWLNYFLLSESRHSETCKVKFISRSLISLRSTGKQGPKTCSCGQRRFWSESVNTQADLGGFYRRKCHL